jgi:hypothetical protein
MRETAGANRAKTSLVFVIVGDVEWYQTTML